MLSRIYFSGYYLRSLRSLGTQVSLILVLFTSSCSNKTDIKECAELDQVPYFARSYSTLNQDSMAADLLVLQKCGGLDSLDTKLLSGPVLGTVLIDLASKENKVTYRTLLERLNQFKETEDYQKFRDAMILSAVLQNKQVSLENFEKDKQVLLDMGMGADELEEFKAYLMSNNQQAITYRQAFERYGASKAVAIIEKKPRAEFQRLTELSEALTSGISKNKKVLVYFSGYACVNCRKLDETVLRDDKVRRIMHDNLICYEAVVDDKSPDSESGASIGSKNIKLQNEKFNSSMQPYFAVLDHKGKVLSEIGYVSSPTEFITFLENGLK